MTSLPPLSVSTLPGNTQSTSTSRGCSHRTADCPHRWSAEEDQYLRDHEGEPWAALARALGRSRKSVTFRGVSVLGLKQGKRPWTDQEDEFLRLNPRLPHKDLAVELRRSWQAVAQRVIFLGLARETLRGEQSPRWKGGSPRHYGGDWHAEVRPRILGRDNFLCQHPGCDVFSPSGDGALLHVHHIIPRSLTQDDSDSNLVTLCHPHHYEQKAHKWTEVTPELIETLPDYQQQILRSVA